MIGFSEDSAREELKRADHLIYVTLKYTRTVDVIKNTIKRLITAFNFAVSDGLAYFKEKKKIKEIPTHINIKADTLIKLAPSLKHYITFYTKLKKIDKADFDKKEEYRKNVTLIVKLNGKVIEANIDVLKEYFQKTIEFVDAIEALQK
jgi:hypothetical protein